MKKNLLLISFLSLVVSGCATNKNYPDKSFIEDNKINSLLADETASQVKSEKINNLKMIISDSFGESLYQDLKKQKINVNQVDVKNKNDIPNFKYFADIIKLNESSKDGHIYRVGYKYDGRNYSKLFSYSANKLNSVSNWSVGKGGK